MRTDLKLARTRFRAGSEELGDRVLDQPPGARSPVLGRDPDQDPGSGIWVRDRDRGWPGPGSKKGVQDGGPGPGPGRSRDRFRDPDRGSPEAGRPGGVFGPGPGSGPPDRGSRTPSWRGSGTGSRGGFSGFPGVRARGRKKGPGTPRNPKKPKKPPYQRLINCRSAKKALFSPNSSAKSSLKNAFFRGRPSSFFGPVFWGGQKNRFFWVFFHFFRVLAGLSGNPEKRAKNRPPKPGPQTPKNRGPDGVGAGLAGLGRGRRGGVGTGARNPGSGEVRSGSVSGGCWVPGQKMPKSGGVVAKLSGGLRARSRDFRTAGWFILFFPDFIIKSCRHGSAKHNFIFLLDNNFLENRKKMTKRVLKSLSR